MSWREFSYFLEGLSNDTPLGRIVTTRAEKDPEILKNFTPEQRRIRYEYQKKIAHKKSDKEVKNAIEQFRQAFIKLAET